VFQYFDITVQRLCIRGPAVVQVIRRSWSNVPGFARILLIVQALVIAGLSAWIYNEYVNNQYLQGYMFSLLDGKGPMLATLGVGGVVMTALVGILLKAGNVLGEIEHLSENVGDGARASAQAPILAEMPVLKIAIPEPRNEIGRLHGSMRRWRDRSRSGE
jgi:hypothetical protein